MKVSIASNLELRRLSALAVKMLKERTITLSTAESCTGGLIAKSITDVPGSSLVLAGGMVTYTNRVKTEVLGVDASVIKEHTEVSHACAEAMAERAKTLFGTDYALSATGRGRKDKGRSSQSNKEPLEGLQAESRYRSGADRRP